MSQDTDFHSTLSTTSSLIAELKGESHQRWHQFVLVYSPLLRFWIHKKSVKPPADDDILQECLASILKGMPQFERGATSGTFRGWLRTIVERRVADYFRNLEPEKYVGSEFLDLNPSKVEITDEEAEEEQRAFDELFARAHAIVRASMSERSYQIFKMTEFEKVPVAEVAKIFDVTPSAVRMVRHRIKNHFQEMNLDPMYEKI